MELEDLTQVLWKAADQRKVCRIHLKGEPLGRTIEPYGVCQTLRNQIMLVCWQSLGFTKAGAKAGYRNLALTSIDEVEVLDTTFFVRADFNPRDSQYKDWVFHV